MLVAPNERVPIARLLQFLEHGERLAHECALAQAALAPLPNMRRFFLSQARQEASHSLVFQGAIMCLAPRTLGASPLLPALIRYRALIQESIAQKTFLETVLAEQVILEGLGEAILGRIEEGLVTRAAPFSRLRRILLRQEEAHHQFGERLLDRAMAAGETSVDALRDQGQQYIDLANEMVETLGDLFESIDEHPERYLSHAKRAWPAWLVAPAEPHREGKES
ncbi:MAG TPA: hypothetical protein VJV04_14585 [Nitrospiraceae bacterium]|nr:hypothetical protein [Nitrospiraceae bacterium]